MKTQLINIATVLALSSSFACGVVEDDIDDIDEIDDLGDDDAGDTGVDAGDLTGAIQVAPLDNDSLQSPAEEHFLSITGERELIYTDEISTPEGDAEDFIEFELPNSTNPSQVIHVTLDCAVTGDADAVARVDILEDGSFGGTLSVFCNNGERSLTVDNTAIQTARISISSAAEATHVDYTLAVVGFR